MRKYISVEVEHTRYARFLSLDQAGENTISLTTLADFQKRAEVKVFLINENQRTLLHEFTIDHLPQRRAGEPRMVLKAIYDGKNKLTLNMSVDGRFYSSTTISIKKHLRPKAKWPWLLLLAFILLAGAAWFLLRTCSTPEESRIPRTEQTEPSKHTESRSSEPAEASETEEQYTEPSAEASAQTDSSSPSGSTSVESSEQAASSTKSAGETVKTNGPEDQTEEEATAQQVVPPELSQIVYFTPNSSQLTETAQQRLSEFMQELRKYEGIQLVIEGHCALYGTEQGREELSRERARKAAQYIQNLGWSPEQPPVIRGLAAQDPVSRDSEKQHLNRRVEITVLPQDSSTSSRRDQ
ncbi:MAG: OmpA family protein [Spirochaetia bacterium]|nr:OmpA family protein [Spirochaetia bacterium]